MLAELNIRNIALIESLRIEFAPGFNVLTGETGSGKSIIVDCMNLVLGSRADRSFLRTGADKGYVQALFDVHGIEGVARFLDENGISLEDGNVLISRELSRSGKNVCRVNGMLVPLNTLVQLAGLLLDIHGQHEHQSLMKPGMHLSFLDAYGDDEHQKLGQSVSSLAHVRAEKARALKAFTNALREKERLQDMLTHQVNEINQAHLKPGEEEKLQSKLEILSNAERIRSAVETAYRLTYQGSGKAISAQEALQNAAAEMERISDFSKNYADLASRLNELFYGVQDVGYELQDALDKLPSDPQMEEKVSARLKLIDKLER
ncbi:MAG: hypothetical protein E7317_12625, partial [Clostridiales bacterium]|nr:hypothetical protein [Clostridiales bacterium]